MEAESEERHLGPLPQDFSTVPVTGVKRRRTLTTSNCGPDLQLAMAQLVTERLNNAGDHGEVTQHYEDYFLGNPVVGLPVSGEASASPESDPQPFSPQMKLRPRENIKRPRHK